MRRRPETAARVRATDPHRRPRSAKQLVDSVRASHRNRLALAGRTRASQWPSRPQLAQGQSLRLQRRELVEVHPQSEGMGRLTLLVHSSALQKKEEQPEPAELEEQLERPAAAEQKAR